MYRLKLLLPAQICSPTPYKLYFWSLTFKAVHIYKAVVRGDSSAGTHSIRSMQWSGAEQRSCHALQKQGCICKRSVPLALASCWSCCSYVSQFASPGAVLIPFAAFPSASPLTVAVKWNEMKWNEILQKHTCLETERQREPRSTLLISVPASDDGKLETTAGNLRPPALGANCAFPDNSNIIMLPDRQQPLGI